MNKQAQHQVNPNIPPPEANSGHGHVWPRADGRKENCGGTNVCKVCQEEQRSLTAKLCPFATVDGDVVLLCALKEGHHLSHRFEREAPPETATIAEAAKRWKESPIKFDRKSYPGDWAICSWCGYSGPHYKGYDEEHAGCEARKLFPPKALKDASPYRVGFLITKTGPGEYGLVKQTFANGKLVQEPIVGNEDWDSLIIRACTHCADMEETP